MMQPVSIAYITAISQVLSLSAKNRALNRLNRLGLHLLFTRIPAGWIPGLHPADLTPAWRRAGLPVEGVGYSTLGSIGDGAQTSNRFWPTSPYYQAWLGGYLIQTPAGFGWSADTGLEVERLLEAAVVDQRTWLTNYGCREPRVSIQPGSFRVLEETTHQDYSAWLVQGTLQSQSDVGAGNRYGDGYFYYRTYELMFARFSGMRLPPLSTLPPVWPLASYHALELDCLWLFVRVGSYDRWARLYACGARWAGRDYFAILRDEALSTIKQTRIISG